MDSGSGTACSTMPKSPQACSTVPTRGRRAPMWNWTWTSTARPGTVPQTDRLWSWRTGDFSSQAATTGSMWCRCAKTSRGWATSPRPSAIDWASTTCLTWRRRFRSRCCVAFTMPRRRCVTSDARMPKTATHGGLTRPASCWAGLLQGHSLRCMRRTSTTWKKSLTSSI